MCGIAGFAVAGDLMPASAQALLQRMADAIAHRGPDDQGFLESGTADLGWRIGLAHRRLAIIDLNTGHQPLANEDGSVQVVFNGEIYNFAALRSELLALGHCFATASDTEVIVHAYEAWGEGCVSRFRGMFAFALWDARRERLFLARDHFGKKPLYLLERPEGLLFASEIKSLLAFPGVRPEVDLDAVWEYLAYRYVPGPATLFQDIRKLPPGSCLIWERGRIASQTRYFRPADRAPRNAKPFAGDPVEAFMEAFDDAVRVRMVSDVPFGAFLSGGIDSSAVVAFMARHSGQPVKTFSVGFAESAYSELAYAKTIADQFQTEHHELTVCADQIMDYLPDLIRYRDAPVAEPSDIPIYLLSREARKSVKMVLTGEGSDEFLGGYPKHVFERFAPHYARLPGWARTGVLEPTVHSLPYAFRRVKTAIRSLGVDRWDERMATWFGATTPRERARLCAADPSNHGVRVKGNGHLAGNSPLRQILYFDQTSWLPDNLLERGDRMTMAASLEARMPFMDTQLAAFVSSLPDAMRVRGLTTKWILRAAMRRVLPADILDRPKVGFRVPVNEWFRGHLKDYLHDHLTTPSSRIRGYFKPGALQEVIQEHVRGRQNHEKLLWTLLTLEMWCRAYGVALPDTSGRG